MFQKKNQTLPVEAINAINDQLRKEFTENGINLTIPENIEIFNKARDAAIAEALDLLKDKRGCTRDVIIITAIAAAGAAATFFLAPVPEQYKVPATIGVAAVGIVADAVRIGHKTKKAKQSALVHIGRMDAFTAMMGINTQKAASEATVNEKPASTVETTTEQIVNPIGNDEETQG
ncbi:MAG: hypothetical protein NC548_05345 [Lachnospiraceae bacterium]|nr:hypothetical protein [Lachnospiraceae bacterium]